MWNKIFISSPDNQSEDDRITDWSFGVVAPLTLAIYGLSCIINKEGVFRTGAQYSYLYNDQYDIPFFGTDAVILGILCLSLASFLHFQFFWRFNKNERLRNNYKYGTFVSILALLPSFVWVVWCILHDLK